MSNNDLNQIRIFILVAQFQSFTRAAEYLEIEKSTVSLKVSQLEKRLGIKLLNRTTRSVALTDAGQHYLGYCQQALSSLEQGEEYLAGLSDSPKGKLRVKMPNDLVSFIMPSVITPFLKRYPEVSLEIIHSPMSGDLIQDQIDIDIQSTAHGIADSSLIYRKIYASEWTLVASPEHIEKFGIPANDEQLLKQPSIGVSPTARSVDGLESIGFNGKSLQLKHRFSVNSALAIKQAVMEGLGFAAMPSKMVTQELAHGSLVDIGNAFKLESTSMYAVYASRLGQPAKLRVFLEELVNWGEQIMKG